MTIVYIPACIAPIGGNFASCPPEMMTSIPVDAAKLQAAELQLSLKPEPVNPETVADQKAIFYTALIVLAALWGLRKLMQLFSSDNERD